MTEESCSAELEIGRSVLDERASGVGFTGLQAVEGPLRMAAGIVGPDSDAITRSLTAFRLGMPLRARNARSLAAVIENPGCTARRVLDAAGVDKAAMAARLGAPAAQQESIFALNRGTRFESAVKADRYQVLIALLREAGFEVENPRVLPLRDRYPIDPHEPEPALAARARETHSAVVAMARGEADAPNLIDGGALRWDYGGAFARLETDGIAWRLGGRIHVIEIKSFPIVDGRADPEKVGEAAWQAAVYVSAITDLLAAAGLDTRLVSSEILLVCPRNTSLMATLARVDVQRQARSLRRLLDGRATIAEALGHLGEGVTLDTSRMQDTETVQHLTQVLERLGTNYLPSCLATCPLAFHCRARARAQGSPGQLGTDVRASLAGVKSLSRVVELADGALAAPTEADAAATLARARRLMRAVDRRQSRSRT
jgi:hypothetical protein